MTRTEPMRPASSISMTPKSKRSPSAEIARADYILDLIAARCGDEVSADDLALLAERDEPIEETIPLEVASQILSVVDQLMTRMERLEASVLSGNDLIASLWRAMADYTIDQKTAMLQRLELLVVSEAASHQTLN